MNIDNLLESNLKSIYHEYRQPFLFGTEEDIIQKEIEKRDDVEELMEWAENHNLSNFESVKEKVKSLCEKRESQEERKKFGCKKCPKQFERKNELLVHVGAIHENDLFKCGKCDKGFAYQTNRVRHEKKCQGTPKTSTGKGIKCRSCDKVLTGHKQIRLHNKEHKSGMSDSIPQIATCEYSILQDQTCENSIPQVPTCENSIPQVPTCENSIPQVPTCANSIPQDPTCENSIPQDPTCENSILQVPTCANSIPQVPTCENSIPQDPTCENSIPQDPTCENSIPQDPTCENSIPKVPTCENSIPQVPTCENSIPQVPTCENSMPQDQTRENSISQDQTCENTDMEIAGPSTDQSSSIPIAKYPSKEYGCQTCNERFQSRRELYLHRNTEHQSGEGPSADIVIPEDQNEQFKVVYKANTKFIYEEDTDDGVQATRNIPLQNDISVNDIPF